MIHGHGDDYDPHSASLNADFSSNVRFDGCPDALLSYLREKLHLINHYPEPDGRFLRQLIGRKHEVDTDQVLLCNGSSDGFYQLAQAFSGAASAVLIPSFAEYEDACNMHGHQLQFFQMEKFLQQDFSLVDLVWLANPNNPDGFIFELQQIQTCLKKFPDTVFVIDEAYEEMCTGVHSSTGLLREFENLVICRSLTKTYGIPGIRLGYLLAGKAVSQRFTRFLTPWSVNVLAIEAGKYILQNEAVLKPDENRICELSRGLQQQINQLEGFWVLESPTGYFLVRMDEHKAADLKQYLLQNHRILIRDASNFKGLDEHYFRIGIQTEDKNKLLVAALKEFSTNE